MTSHRRTNWKTCLECGEEFLGTKKKVYCDECIRKIRCNPERAGFTQRFCEVCSKPLLRKEYESLKRYNKKRTCGYKCKIALMRKERSETPTAL